MSDSGIVERAFATHDLFKREQRPQSNIEPAEFYGIPATTCHTVVHTQLKRASLESSYDVSLHTI